MSTSTVAVVEAARALGLRLAPQGAGYNAGPLGPLDHTIQLRTSSLRGAGWDGARSGAARD